MTNPNCIVSFDPVELREHFDVLNGRNPTDGLSDHELTVAAIDTLDASDDLWDQFNNVCDDILALSLRRQKEERGW